MPSSQKSSPVSGKPKKVIRMAEIANHAGVSARVVSKVLFPGSSNNARASKATAEKIRKAAKELGYLPNLTARQLAIGRSYTFGVLIQSPMIPIHFKLLADLEHHASRHNYRLMIGQIITSGPFFEKVIEGFINDYASRGVDGVICFVHESRGVEDRLREIYRPIPNIVFVTVPPVKWADWIGTDLAEGVFLLVKHLHSLGRRHIVLFQPDSIWAPYRERVRGFEAALQKYKLRRENCFPWHFFEPSEGGPKESIHAALEKLLATHPETDAVIALNDLIAMYVMQYLQENGIAIPEKIAVTGFDNLPTTAATIPPLTSVDQCMEEVAAKTIELLRTRIEMPDRAPECVYIKPKLHIRESSARRGRAKDEI